MKQWQGISKHTPWIIIALTLIWLPFFWSGVFFRQGHIQIDIVILTMTGITALYYGFIRLKARQIHRATPNPDRQSQSSMHVGSAPSIIQASSTNKPLTVYDYAFFLYILLYIAAIFHAASFTRAVIGAFDALALLFPYLLFRFAAAKMRESHWVVAGIAISSVVINLVGMGSSWGFIDFPSAYANGQVSSVFQYHNAYASFEGAVSLALLSFLALGGARTALARSLYAGVASLALAGLLMSGSRGALLFFAIVFVLLLIGFRARRKESITQAHGAPFMFYFYLCAISVGVGYHDLHQGILSGNSGDGWLGIGLTVVFPIAVILVADRILRKRELSTTWRKWTSFRSLLFGGVILALLAAIAKHHALLTKLHTYHVHQLSVVQRFIFWQDGLKIVAKDPLFGLGGGAWPTLFQMVQRYPYWSTRVHSFVVQTAMEVGLVGLAAFTVALWPTIRAAVWPYREYESDFTARALSILALALFAHSMMDWDMSFSYLRILLTIGMGSAAGIAAAHKSVTGQVSSSASPSASRTSQIAAVFQKHPGAAPIIAIVFGLALIIPISTGIRMNEAMNLANSAGTLPLSETKVQLLQKAQSLAPFEAQYASDLGTTRATIVGALKLTGAQAQNANQAALQQQLLAAKLDPYNPSIQQNAAALAYQLGDVADAYTHATLAFQDAPFHASNAEMAIDAGAAYAMTIARSNPTLSHTVFLTIQSTYKQYLRREQIVRNLPSYLPPSTPYQLRDFTYNSLAATALALHQPSQALQFASKALPSKTSHTHQLARLIILLADQVSGQSISIHQIQSYVASHSSLKTSYAMLLNVL